MFRHFFSLGRKARSLSSVAATRPKSFRPALDELETRLVPSSVPLHVLGNQLVNTQTNQPVVLRGVNVGGLEGFGFAPDMVNNSVQEALDDWHANLIRLPVNQDYWLGVDPDIVDAGTYQAEVDNVISMASSHGAYVVLDVQVSDGGTSDPSQEGQYSMPDDNTTVFWAQAGQRYANNPTVFFDPFNEPGHYDVSWDQWRNGGTIDDGNGSTYDSPGLQGLLDTIRGTGAKNIVVPEGINYATDFSPVLNGYGLSDPNNNLMYQIHIYPGSAAHAYADELDSLLPPDLTASYPVYVGEWGSDENPGPEGTPLPDATTWNTNMLQWLDQHSNSWTAWAMNDSPFLTYPGDPTPTPYFGVLVRQDLIQHSRGPEPMPGGARAAFADTYDWGSGLTGSITLANTGNTTINGRTLQFDFTGNITEVGNAQIVSQVGNHSLIRNESWDATIAPGQSIDFGFNAWWGDPHTGPSNYVLIGVSIDGV